MKEIVPLKINRRELLDVGLAVAIMVLPLANLTVNFTKIAIEESKNVPKDVTGGRRVLASALGMAGLPILRAEVINDSR